MASTLLRRAVPGLVLLLLAGCDQVAPDYCTADCPLPVTQPPVVTWLFPAPGATVGMTTDLVVKVSDDIRVDHVEFFHSQEWIKLHPGVIGAAPWHAELGKYRPRTDFPPLGGPITLQAVAWDIEGHSDTAYITVNFQ